MQVSIFREAGQELPRGGQQRGDQRGRRGPRARGAANPQGTL